MKPYRAVLFDLDGTLLDTLNDLTEGMNRALRQMGYPPCTKEEARSYLGNGGRVFAQKALPLQASQEEAEACYQAFRQQYARCFQETTKPYPGVLKLLCALHKKGYRIGVVTNKYREAAEALCEAFFVPYVECVEGERAQVPKKPAPNMPLRILEKWGILPQETLFVGDSSVDALTALHTGMDCALVTWGFSDAETLRSFRDCHIIEEPMELLGVLQEEKAAEK